MGLIVQKFGGTSVKDRDRIFNVARIVANTRNQGNDVVVVVSAQGDTTDDLITKAAEITSDPSHREMDMLLATGEQISISLLAMAGNRWSTRWARGWAFCWRWLCLPGCASGWKAPTFRKVCGVCPSRW